MEVIIRKDGLLIRPETDFEEQYITAYFNEGELTTFVKRSYDNGEALGIKIQFEQPPPLIRVDAPAFKTNPFPDHTG